MMCGGNGVRGHPYTYPQHRMTPNHLLSVSDVCEMQLERFYSLSHSAVAWSRHVINLTGIRLWVRAGTKNSRPVVFLL